MFLWWPRMDKPNTSAPLVANTGEHEWTGRRDERPSHNKSISMLYQPCLHTDVSHSSGSTGSGEMWSYLYSVVPVQLTAYQTGPPTSWNTPESSFHQQVKLFCSSMLVSYKHKLIRLHVVVEKDAKEKCSERHIRSVALIFSLASTRFFAWMHHYEMFIATM